ncbi:MULTISPECIES: DNA repair protein RadA [unclassified Arthrobacter]|uniref:DNA repair protein RadA n=1 Tax=unclassified Arthrobacter TaxID=235627 RepID=UPI0014918186|nr:MULTISPECIES: DNA repair protein RadA [unclassified Arthrobacter]MBE0008371.1 DNA repair protein RadA [Arthrobacter sp. AET 35A]NOJ59398.1 DNA repair protein RadA [Arthrobacter sp. 260]NOJ62110.1 DNA repair protein RadA [Arthrobacter sp. 147(2020)]
MATKTARPARTSAPAYRCGECGWTTAKWVGRCGECQAWGTVEETGQVVARTTAAVTVASPALRISEIDASAASYQPTQIGELDRVLGGGLVPGAVILLAGEPGVGKSTLVLDVAARVARLGKDVLYITGEESSAQVKLRAERIGALAETLYLTAESDLGQALGQVERLSPSLLIVDSVQTLSSSAVDGTAGGVTQVREVAASLIAAAKTRGMTTILVGHVTKDGSIAGPRLLEHLVDVVCQFEGDRHSRLRLMRAIKNRYGPTDEVGCFDLTETGVEGLADPSGLFVSRTKDPVSGTCITVTLEGRRPLLAEVQALLAESSNSQPRRATSGLDSSRVAMLLAVLQQRASLSLHKDDSYVATVGGVKLSEPATDLAVALAIASAKTNQPLAARLIAFGEVGLAGEVRPVPGIAQRVQEAERLGFTHAVVPASPNGPGKVPAGFTVHEVSTLTQALELLF